MPNDIQRLLAQQLVAVQTVLDFNKEISSRVARAANTEDRRRRPQGDSGAVWCCQAEVRPHLTYLERDPIEKPEMVMLQPLLTRRASASKEGQLDRTTSPAPDSGKQERVNHFFPHVEEIRATVTDSLRRQTYNVEDCYKDTGCFSLLARHNYFKICALVVIALNTVWIAIETDYNKADVLSQAPMVFQVVDNLFTCFFLFEIFVRYMAFKATRHAFGDSWFLFDATLVLLMVWETWVLVILYEYFSSSTLVSGKGLANGSSLLRLFRLVRLIRVARAGRLLSSAPELMLLVKGIVAAVRSVLAVLCLLFLVIYVFAVIFTELLSDSPVGSGRFDTVPVSLNTLMLQVLCGPDAHFINELLAVDAVYYVLILFFLLVALLTIMNMLIGILCGVVADVTEAEKEEAFMAEVDRQIHRLAESIDEDGTGTIDQEEFATILKDPEMTRNFYELGVDIVGAADFAKFIFSDVNELSFADFTHLVSQFRGTKNASIKDIMDMRKFVSMELETLGDRIAKEEEAVKNFGSKVGEEQRYRSSRN